MPAMADSVLCRSRAREAFQWSKLYLKGLCSFAAEGCCGAELRAVVPSNEPYGVTSLVD